MIKPVFAEHSEDNVGIAQNLIEQFSSFIGKRKGLLNDELHALEEDTDYRFLRGLFTLLERRTITEQLTSYSPFHLREAVFELTNQLCGGAVITQKEREFILTEVSKRLGIPEEDLTAGLWGDEDDELIIKSFESLTAEELIGRYNLSLLQTMLFKATVLEVSFRFVNIKELLRRIRFYGLMYDIEKQGEYINLVVNGPVSVLKMTRRYGTSLAKFLPYAIKTDDWRLRADILEGKRVLKFSLTQEEFNRYYVIDEVADMQMFDSSVEEKFFKQFRSLGSNWIIKREPEPLIKDSTVMIPDFSFEGYNRRIFMEIMGFWTPDYVKRKLEKLKVLSSDPGMDIILCVDENLQCSPSRLGFKNVIRYKKRIPVKEIIKILSKYEREQIDMEIDMLNERFREDDLTPVVELDKLSEDVGVSLESMKRFLNEQKLSGYVFTGNLLVSKGMMSQLYEKLEGLRMRKGTYKQALSLIGDTLDSEFQTEIFDKMGFTIDWSSLNVSNAVIKRKKIREGRK